MGLQDVVHLLLGSTSALAAELGHSINASSLWVFKMYCTSSLVLKIIILRLLNVSKELVF